LKASCRSDKGLLRKINQDWAEVKTISDSSILAVVCDGIGGTAGGEIASKTASEKICRYFEKNFKLDEYDYESLVLGSINVANNKILEISRSKNDIQNLGTTVVLAFVHHGSIYVANVGDSRAYLISDSKIEQITKDHSLLQELISEGKITKEEAKNSPNKHIITRALGPNSNSQPELYTRFIGLSADQTKNFRLLLCSDGLNKELKDDEIKEIVMKHEDHEIILERLIQKAKDYGGSDNITAAIIF